MEPIDFKHLRRRLVDELQREGITDEEVLRAMLTVHREDFVPDQMRAYAYQNSALPIACGQTISQPYIVALMTQALDLAPKDRVLEIGTGSGYAAAVMACIAKDVYSIERLPDLAVSAAEKLVRLGFDNVHVRHDDGTRGWPEQAPFDGIAVTAGAPRIPPALLQELKTGGRLVIPVGEEEHAQRLIRVIRRGPNDFESTDLGGVMFVPLIGESAWGMKTDDRAISDRARHSPLSSNPSEIVR